MIFLFFKACLVGLLATAPYGPLGMFALQKTVKSNAIATGMRIGAGCVMADGIILFCALLFGARFLNWIDPYQLPLTCLAALVLVVAGVLTWRHHHVVTENVMEEKVTMGQGMTHTMFGFIFTISHAGNWAGIFAIVAVTGLLAASVNAGTVVFSGYVMGGVLMWLVFLFVVKFLAGKLLKEPQAFAVKMEKTVAVIMLLCAAGLGISAVWQAAIPG